MPPPPKKSNNSSRVPQKTKKPENAFRPMPFAVQSTSAALPTEPRNPRATKPSTSTAPNDQEPAPSAVEQPEDFHLCLQHHRGFVFDKFLGEMRSKKDHHTKIASATLRRNAVKDLKQRVKRANTELAKSGPIHEWYQEIANYPADKLQICDVIERELEVKYCTMLDTLNRHMITIEQIHGQIDKVNGVTVKEEMKFDRDNDLYERKLDSINKKIDFAINKRDNICAQIAEALKAIDRMLPSINNFRSTNQQLNIEITVLKRKFENGEQFLINNTHNFYQWVTEKTVAVDQMKREKSKLKKETKKIKYALNIAKTETENLRNKVTQLTEDTAKKTDLLTRIQKANENMRDDSELHVEFNQGSAALLANYEKLFKNSAAMQSEMSTVQGWMDDLQRIKTGILLKQQSRDNAQRKLRELEGEKWKKEHKVSIMEEYINEARNRAMKSAGYSPKRKRSSQAGDVKSIILDKGSQYATSSFDTSELY